MKPGKTFTQVRSCFVMLALCAAVQANAQGANSRPSAGSIAVKSGSRQTILSPNDLAKLARHDFRIASEGTGDSVTVSGVALWDMLQLLGVPAAEASGRQRAVMYVRLTGLDGQNAVLALVEIDPSFSRRTVLVADRRDGKPLDQVEGPWRVFIPDELRHARWIRGLSSVEVTSIRP